MMKKYTYFGLVFLLPVILLFDVMSFMLSRVTCLTCDLSDFVKSSSMTVSVTSHMWQLLRKQS